MSDILTQEYIQTYGNHRAWADDVRYRQMGRLPPRALQTTITTSTRSSEPSYDCGKKQILLQMKVQTLQSAMDL